MIDGGPIERFYLCGPMAEYEQFNYPLFLSVAAELRERGYDIVSPAEINANLHNLDAPETSAQRSFYLRRTLQGLIRCTGIIMLPGWKESKGACLEHYIAQELGMTIRYWKDGEVTA